MKALHIIGGIALPLISIISAISDFNSDKSTHTPSFKMISLYEETYGSMKNEIDSVLADRAVAKHATLLSSAADTLQAHGRDIARLQQDFRRILADSLFTGRYIPLPGDVANVVFTRGMMMGFENYRMFFVKDHLVPEPLYEGLDIITFQDADGISHEYSWRFSGDTLLLTKMVLSIEGNRLVPWQNTRKFLKI